MSTRFQDCLSEKCLFSTRHEHPIGCRSQSCTRLMSPPKYNPIRVSPSMCADCVRREREGILGLP
ncbi:hypothetical protein PILCRDRAFT_815500 [Piloderma croceum F 1598]|uniref:Uncharacterized protein n=1 Tax=Piloderma croceum (strain F 1598) TaxID=765440 RepID=A0A0C3G8S0_PILCF|nr:hypothetical protein PILCRDRAFT_815500 [Piloderma croceum F 1598]